MSKFQKIVLLLIIIAATFLRFSKLSENPPGLYWDEAVIGYDAYSILNTAHDHHGRLLPLFFESFGDWKLPVYIYLDTLVIFFFGLNEFAVRFPSAFFGTLTIFVFFLLIQKLTKNTSLALLASFFFAISPWHIQFSRAGFESTVGLFMAIAATYFLLHAFEKQKTLFFTVSLILFTLSIYTYHAYRIFTPLLLIALIFIFRKEIKRNLSKIIVPSFICLVLLVPILFFSLSPQGRLRATSQSVFQKEEFERQDVDYNQKSKKPLRFMSRYLYKKPLYYSFVATNAYFDHFSPTFLFSNGDQIGRHSQVDMGQLYIFELPLILASFFGLKNLNKKTKLLILTWLLLSPVPATIVSVTPHANRTLQMAPMLAALSAIGFEYIFFKIKPLFFKLVLVALLSYYFFLFLHLLFVHYPVKFSPDWQDGNRSMVHNVKKFQDKYSKVLILNNDQAYIYLLFYLKYNPQKFIEENGNKERFGKYFFISTSYDIYNKEALKEKILYVAPSWQKVDGNNLTTIKDTGGRQVYTIWEVGGQD